jgi:sugar O-acyltransferase (sialic acid O-acetyltransferase NeuD family)
VTRHYTQDEPDFMNILIGAGGHARETEWMLNSLGLTVDYFVVTDDFRLSPSLSLVRPVIKMSEVPGRLSGQEDIDVYCAIGDPRIRLELLRQITGLTFQAGTVIRFPTINDPANRKPARTNIGEGTLINCGTTVTCDIKIGSFAMINRACNVSHDCVLGDFVTLGVGVNLSGGVVIEDFAELGSGVTVIPGKRIGRGAIVGAGSTVVADIPPLATAVGVPSRVIKTNLLEPDNLVASKILERSKRL